MTYQAIKTILLSAVVISFLFAVFYLFKIWRDKDIEKEKKKEIDRLLDFDETKLYE